MMGVYFLPHGASSACLLLHIGTFFALLAMVLHRSIRQDSLKARLFEGVQAYGSGSMSDARVSRDVVFEFVCDKG